MNTDPRERVLELLTDQHFTRERIMEAATLLDDCLLAMKAGTIDVRGVAESIDTAVCRLHVALGLPPLEAFES